MEARLPLLQELFRMIVKMIVGGVLIILLFSCGVASIGAAGAGADKSVKGPTSEVLYGDEDSANAILRVDITGPILTHAPGDDSGFFSSINMVTYGYEVKEQLLEAAKDDDVKAVMLFVTTPGGSIVGSEAINDGVLAVKAAGKPVIAYVDTISASGGVWSTASADKIFADHGSVIGSVGVNFGNWLYYDDPVALDGGLFGGGVDTRGGVKASFIGAGLGKDLGNPFRPMSEREAALLNGTAQQFYDDFVEHVVSNRPIDRTALVEEYGAMIFGNEGAEQRGYIDGSKTFQETLAYIGEAIGAEGDDYKLISPPTEKKTPFEELFGATLKAFAGESAVRAQKAAVCAELTARPVAIYPQAQASLCGA